MVYTWLPAIPYPPLKESRWAPVTSTINFCEEDYYLTPYVAEVLNVTTNSIFLYLAAKGFHNALTQGHSPVFAIAFMGYSIIGMGSILFHSTLKYPMQLVDELAMIYTTLIMCFATFSYGRQKFVQWSILFGCVFTGATITGVYHWVGNPLFHQNAFGIIMAVLLFHSMYLMESLVRQQSKEAVTLMWKMVGYGLGIFLSGFALWNIDNIYCNELRRFRRKIGMPWGFLFELHALWHIGTGIGGYYLIVWGEYLRICMDGKQDQYKLIWPSYFTSFPHVDKISANELRSGKKRRNRVANGSVAQLNGSASNGAVLNGKTLNGGVSNGKASNGKISSNGKASNGKAKSKSKSKSSKKSRSGKKSVGA